MAGRHHRAGRVFLGWGESYWRRNFGVRGVGLIESAFSITDSDAHHMYIKLKL